MADNGFPAENAEAAYEGFRHLARTAENDRLRFRACEYLLSGGPIYVYHEGFVDPADLPTRAVPVVANTKETIVRLEGADIG